ncbi:MAG TPA: protein kinase, partial [Ornithinimicrobium sp.]|nr:protein kinase [Ornithinimicrobium sp.]
ILSAGELVTALQPVAGALADLHGTGVVHGDLSTGNVLFLRDGMPVLGDLGAARITGEGPGPSLGTGAAEGMVAPEVVEGFSATPESDVYQLGALAWRCLAGGPPGPPYDRGELTEQAPGLPPGLADLVLRCMAPDPEARPDAEEVALALLACATPEPIEVAPDADPAHGLTERLRSEARADLDTGPEEGPRAGGAGTHRRRRASGSRAMLVPVVLVVASLLLVVGALAVVRAQLPGPQAPDARPQRVLDDGHTETTATTTGTATTRTTGTSGAGDAEGDRADEGEGTGTADGGASGPTPPVAPQDDDMAQVLQDLLDARGEAWERADDVLLAGVVAPDSPAEVAETEQLVRLRESGVRYPDVTFRVEEATVEAGGQAEEVDRLVLRATISRAALQGRDGQGRRLDPVAASTERVDVELARVGDLWLLWSWEPTSAR